MNIEPPALFHTVMRRPYRLARLMSAVLATVALGCLVPAVQARAEVDPKETMRQAAALIQRGEFEAAAVKLQEVLTADPSLVEAKKGLASLRASQGHAALQAGSLMEAKGFIEKAIALDPDNPELHVLLAVILIRQGDYYYARWSAKKAIEIDPEHSRAHEILGDVLYQDGYLDLAIPEWEAALKRSPLPGMLQAKIEKTRKELAIEESFGRQVSRHFTLLFDGPIPRGVTETVLRHLEDAHYTLGRELGCRPPGDITVILYSRMAFKEVTRSPDWVGGTFDGKVRVPVGGLTTEHEAESLKPILRHELTHAFLRSMVPQGLPLWLEEGLAEYFEGMPPEMATRWLSGHPADKFNTLTDVVMGLRGRGPDVMSSYMAAYLAVTTLVDRVSFANVRRLLESMGTGTLFDKALEGEARLTLPEFEELWRRNLP